jgi:hypothetical protein
LPRNNQSVIAALLEREPPMSPRYQWNMLEPLRSLEIVWGNGDKFYTRLDNFRAYTLAFPSWRAWADAAHAI